MGKIFNALNKAAESEAEDSAVEVPVMESAPPLKKREEKNEAPPAAAEAALAPPAFRPQTVDLSSGNTGNWDERLVLSTAITGAVAESIRTLRTRILHPYAGRVPRSLLITSASPGEGKSFICANLGVSLAQGVENHCLVVDCDLRRPSQHRLFGLSNKAGLSDYLQRKKKLPELLVPSGVDKLSILPGGPLSVNPAELLGSSTMPNLIDELVQRYDDRIILLDSPPLHAASETAILSRHVDGVILVVRYGVSRREHIKTLVETIGRDKIVGVVFNAYQANLLDSKVFGYYDYQKDYYYPPQS